MLTRSTVKFGLSLALIYLPTHAQVPQIRNVVNAANLAPDPQRGSLLVGGNLAVINGEHLATDSAQADGYPLPTQLAGTSVRIDGHLAPVLSVTSNTITFQAPSRSFLDATDHMASLVVEGPLGASEVILVPYVSDALGLYTQEGSACGVGLVENVAADGSTSANSTANSASPGDFIQVYGTGGGDAYRAPPDGVPAGNDPASVLVNCCVAFLGLAGFESPFDPGVIGLSGWLRILAPGKVGVDLLRMRLPKDAPEGCAIPLSAQGFASTSQPVFISVHNGGGQCQDADLGRVGGFHWTKTIVNPYNFAQFIPGVSNGATDTFEAAFIEAPANLITGPPPRSSRVRGPGCPGAAGRGLDAGTLAVIDQSGNSYSIAPSVQLGTLKYLQVTLPPGTIQAGPLGVSAGGGADIGAFQAQLNFPDLIQIQTPISIGMKFSATKGATITWTGGTADERVWIESRNPGQDFVIPTGTGLPSVSGDSGVAALRPPGAFHSGESFDLIVIVTPATASAGSFSAPGLPQPGTQDWVYAYRFTGLVWQ